MLHLENPKPLTTRRDRGPLLLDPIEPTLGEIADAHHDHPDLPRGRLRNGCWRCIGCGRIVPKRGTWLNWCSDCGYDEWE